MNAVSGATPVSEHNENKNKTETVELEETAPGNVVSPAEKFVQELVRWQTLGCRKLRRPGPMHHPGLLPYQSLEVARWRGGSVFGVEWSSSGQHIKGLEHRAILAAVKRRRR